MLHEVKAVNLLLVDQIIQIQIELKTVRHRANYRGNLYLNPFLIV